MSFGYLHIAGRAHRYCRRREEKGTCTDASRLLIHVRDITKQKRHNNAVYYYDYAKQLFEIIVIVHKLSSIQSVEAVITYGKPSQYTLQSHWNRYYYGGTVIQEL